MRIVYDANNSLDAHVVQHLLENEGIEAYIQGEHLQGGVGELSAMNLVKVSVSDQDASRARSVIETWEMQQPADTSSQDYGIAREDSGGQGRIFFAFLFGFIAGVIAAYVYFKLPAG